MSAVLEGIGMGVDALNSLFNLGSQYQNYQYQKELQQEVFAREDTAIQRRVADLKAAGLNPVLASGQGASAGQVVSTQAPQSGLDMLGYLSAVSQVGVSKAQQDLLKKQGELTALEERIKDYDFQFAKDSGLPTSTDPNLQALLKYVSDAFLGGSGSSGQSASAPEIAAAVLNPNRWAELHDPDTRLGKQLASRLVEYEEKNGELTEQQRLELYKYKRGYGPKPDWYKD